MEKRLYGIKKVFTSDEMNIDHPLNRYCDGEYVSDRTIWEECKLVKPGSLSYKFEMINGRLCCSMELDFLPLFENKNAKFYMCEDMKGKRHLIGLGNKYMTVPQVNVENVIGEDPGTGCKTSVKITWKNDAGRIFAC